MSAPSPRRVVTAGLHVADILGRYVERIPDAQGIALLEEIRLTVAGTAAAIAVNLAKLGVDVATVGAIGDDALGRFLSTTMAEAGVDVTRLRVSPDHPTSATMLPIRPDGSRPALHVIGSNGAISADDLSDEILDGISVLHLGGSCLLPGIDGTPSADLLRRARERGVVTTMDFIPAGRPEDRDAILPCLPYVDVLLPSLEDALSFAGAADRDAAIDFYLAAGVRTLVITMGGEGVSISSAARRDHRLPAYDVDVVDTTGCGDAFSAGFITAVLDGADAADPDGAAQAAEWGLACGSLVATGLGSDAGFTSRADLEQFRATGRRYPLPA